MRTCKDCEETKPATEFYRSKGYKDGIDGYCKPCRLKKNREFIDKNPNYHREYYQNVLKQRRKEQRAKKSRISKEV